MCRRGARLSHGPDGWGAGGGRGGGAPFGGPSGQMRAPALLLLLLPVEDGAAEDLEGRRGLLVAQREGGDVDSGGEERGDALHDRGAQRGELAVGGRARGGEVRVVLLSIGLKTVEGSRDIAFLVWGLRLRRIRRCVAG